jgi:hypothetical protein
LSCSFNFLLTFFLLFPLTCLKFFPFISSLLFFLYLSYISLLDPLISLCLFGCCRNNLVFSL